MFPAGIFISNVDGGAIFIYFLCIFIFLDTLRCLSVKTTGSVRKTLLDSLLMEAAMMCELTASRFLSCHGPSASIFTVAFSVDRKEPKFLYITNTTLTCPAKRRETNEKMNRNNKKKTDGEEEIL